MLLILDVDGVLTDGKKYYDKSGQGVLKTFCDRDFTAIKQFKAAGWNVVLLTGDHNINEAIANNRKIPIFFTRDTGGMIDKASFVEKLEKVFLTKPADMFYVGDDIFDISIMIKVGHKYCPADAHFLVKSVWNIIVLDTKGGDGCVVDLLQLLCSQGYVDPSLAHNIEKVIELDRNEKF